MKLISVKCDSCGANLKIENTKKGKITCEYCGSTFLLDDDTSTVQHIMAGEITEEQEFINAETNLNKFQEYEDSFNGYEKLSKRYVDNKEVWIGLLRSKTEDFSKSDYDLIHIKECDSYWKKYCALATQKEIDKYESKYEHYKEGAKKTSPVQHNYQSEEKSKKLTYFVITAVMGFTGIHHFINKRWGMGLLYLCTGGIIYIGWIVDAVNAYQDYKNCI